MKNNQDHEEVYVNKETTYVVLCNFWNVSSISFINASLKQTDSWSTQYPYFHGYITLINTVFSLEISVLTQNLGS